MLRQEIKKILNIPDAEIEPPENKNFGDYSTSVALKLAKKEGKNPMEIAKELKSRVEKDGAELFERVDIVAPGFVNFFLSKEYLQNQIREILKQKEKFGELQTGEGQKVNVEFISANPTGPLHIGNARGGFGGDVLANILEKTGCKVSREYYVNDMGRQILFLDNSLNNKEPSYNNQYIDELRAKGEKEVKAAIKYIVGKIKETTDKMRIEFDTWFYESDLRKEREKVLKIFEKNKLIYEKDGAIWFKSSELGDDKDRVLKRSEEKTTYSEETYILSDAAYLMNKFERKFDCLVIILGAEHYGYIARLKAAAKALGYEPEKVKPVIMQLVRLVEKGQELKMSKRTGAYITIDELIDEVGIDVSRYFFLTRSFGSHLLFDMDLAKEQSEKNPVYYIQYAYARICSILRKAKDYKPKSEDFGPLNEPAELDLIKEMIRFPEIIEVTARDYQIQRISQYALDLVISFHKFYEQCRVIDEKNLELTQARLALISATQIVLKNTLDLMGILAPERM